MGMGGEQMMKVELVMAHEIGYGLLFLFVECATIYQHSISALAVVEDIGVFGKHVDRERLYFEHRREVVDKNLLCCVQKYPNSRK